MKLFNSTQALSQRSGTTPSYNMNTLCDNHLILPDGGLHHLSKSGYGLNKSDSIHKYNTLDNLHR
jgi:hypothetical protein